MELVEKSQLVDMRGRAADSQIQQSFNYLLPKFFDYLLYEEELAFETIAKYQQALKRILIDLTHIRSPLDLRLDDITELKKVMKVRGVGPAGINSAVFALRKFLTYCQKVHGLKTIDPKEIQRAQEQGHGARGR